jgi:hypothetical protein
MTHDRPVSEKASTRNASGTVSSSGPQPANIELDVGVISGDGLDDGDVDERGTDGLGTAAEGEADGCAFPTWRTLAAASPTRTAAATTTGMAMSAARFLIS